MFAEPAITEIEEVVCLVHGEKKKAKAEGRIQKTALAVQSFLYSISFFLPTECAAASRAMTARSNEPAS